LPSLCSSSPASWLNCHCLSPSVLITLPYTSVMLKTTKNTSESGKNFTNVSPKTGTTENLPITWLNELFSMLSIDREFRHKALLTREKFLRG
jgi:hypothetical protein